MSTDSKQILVVDAEVSNDDLTGINTLNSQMSERKVNARNGSTA